MKKRVLVGMTALLLSLSLLMAQEIPAGVITAFKRGSSQELSKYMGDKVNLVLQGRSTNVDKQKATAAMQWRSYHPFMYSRYGNGKIKIAYQRSRCVGWHRSS